MTNYRKRYNLLKSKITRLIFRISTKYAYASLADYDPKGDKLITTFSTKEFGKYKKNKEVCFKLGEKIGSYIEENCNEIILDIGRKKIYTEKVLYFIKGVKEHTTKAKINMEKLSKYYVQNN